ncbi:hypothetical protein J2X20_004202 [Pelomonas saccharophila]|uniref:DUF2845 domain-containing protein n=1 Tax=Roseateles saccharophilus TaxID=304 RepID=A0ABU1YRR0_ROSSA|nr:DUF2845 domain-containing protein [Roseateles saccharophilus]MDR7271534.1 hypothetical protein [Roseateles saccharophilus]
MAVNHKPRLSLKASVLAALLGAGSAVHADPLRCNDTSIQEGDAKVWLIRACGQPTVSDSYCARMVQPVPAQYGYPSYQTVCVVTEEWLYDRGPGNLMAVVRIREGRIISIRYGQQGLSASR